MVTILMMSAKMVTPGLCKIKVFWKNGYDFIISVSGVTNKILSRDSNHTVDVVTGPKFGNSSISMREVIIPQLCKDMTTKTAFLRGGLSSSSIIWD